MVAWMGRYFVVQIEHQLRLIAFFIETIINSIAGLKYRGPRAIIKVIATQVYFTGWQAFWMIAILAFIISAGFVIIMHNSMFGFGQLLVTVKVFYTVVVRELGPLITALIVIARSGTAVAIELGNMKVNREIDALISMGINPLDFVVLPRLLGGILSLIALNIYFLLFALIGILVILVNVKNYPVSIVYHQMAMNISLSDFFIILAKSFLAGLIIFTVACYQGLSAQRSPTEVPVVTTQAVVQSIAIIFFWFTLGSFFYYWLVNN